MKIIILTPVRILGEGLDACFSRRPEFTLLATVPDLPSLRAVLRKTSADLVLIDVTQGIDLEEVRVIAEERIDVALMALGLCEQRPEVIRCGRAGFVGYVSREATIDELCQAMTEVMTGRLRCSAAISGALLRALFRLSPGIVPECPDATLTRREGEVLQLIGRGLSNKEIARELRLSTATIKHHVHGVLGKLQVARRMQAMRRVREAPWLVSSALATRRED
jgi:two-component system nitrate/nitrite response regulator NarL